MIPVVRSGILKPDEPAKLLAKYEEEEEQKEREKESRKSKDEPPEIGPLNIKVRWEDYWDEENMWPSKSTCKSGI